MVLEKGLLGEPALGGGHGLPHHVALGPGVLRAHAVHVAGHQFQRCILVGRPAAVVDRDPAGEIDVPFVRRQHHDVVGLPSHTGCEVTRLHGLLRALAVQQPHQRRLRDESRRQRREHQTSPRIHCDASVLEFVDGALLVPDQSCAQRFTRSVLVLHDEFDRLTEVLLHQAGRRDEVVLEVLFQHVQRPGRVERDDMNRGRIDLRGHTLEPEVLDPAGQGDGSNVLHQPQVVIVDGDTDRLLVGRRAAAVGGRCACRTC